MFSKVIYTAFNVCIPWESSPWPTVWTTGRQNKCIRIFAIFWINYCDWIFIWHMLWWQNYSFMTKLPCLTCQLMGIKGFSLQAAKWFFCHLYSYAWSSWTSGSNGHLGSENGLICLVCVYLRLTQVQWLVFAHHHCCCYCPHVPCNYYCLNRTV